MDQIIRFRLIAASKDECGIREVEGRLGGWPFRRTLRFCVGVNCDAIEPAVHGVAVYRRGWLIARGEGHITLTRRPNLLGAGEWLRKVSPR